MRKILLFALISLTLAGVCGCAKSTNSTDNPTTISGETETIDESGTQAEGVVTIDKEIAAYLTDLDPTTLFVLAVECDREWEDVYTNFILANDIEECRKDKIIYITKKQLEQLKPVAGYDIFLRQVGGGYGCRMTKERVDKLDKKDLYYVKIGYKPDAEYATYSGGVDALLDEYEIDKSSVESYISTLECFYVKISGEAIVKLFENERIDYIERVIYERLTDF